MKIPINGYVSTLEDAANVRKYVRWNLKRTSKLGNEISLMGARGGESFVFILCITELYRNTVNAHSDRF
jgi:hypothetical protein